MQTQPRTHTHTYIYTLPLAGRLGTQKKNPYSAWKAFIRSAFSRVWTHHQWLAVEPSSLIQSPLSSQLSCWNVQTYLARHVCDDYDYVDKCLYSLNPSMYLCFTVTVISGTKFFRSEILYYFVIRLCLCLFWITLLACCLCFVSPVSN